MICSKKENLHQRGTTSVSAALATCLVAGAGLAGLTSFGDALGTSVQGRAQAEASASEASVIVAVGGRGEAAIFSPLLSAAIEGIKVAVRGENGIQLRNWVRSQGPAGRRVGEAAELLQQRVAEIDHFPSRAEGAELTYRLQLEAQRAYTDALAYAAQGEHWEAIAELTQAPTFWDEVRVEIVGVADDFAADEHLFGRGRPLETRGSAVEQTVQQAPVQQGPGQQPVALFHPLSSEEAGLLRKALTRSLPVDFRSQGQPYGLNHPERYKVFVDELRAHGGPREQFIASTIEAIKPKRIPTHGSAAHWQAPGGGAWRQPHVDDSVRLSWVTAFLLATEGKLDEAKRAADRLAYAKENPAEFERLIESIQRFASVRDVGDLPLDRVLRQVLDTRSGQFPGRNGVFVRELIDHPDPRGAEVAAWVAEITQYIKPDLFTPAIDDALAGRFIEAYERLDNLGGFDRSPGRKAPWDATLKLVDFLAEESGAGAKWHGQAN